MSICTFDRTMSMQPSMHSLASDTPRKKHFHTGSPKPQVAGIVWIWFFVPEMACGGPDRLCRGTLLSRQQYLADVRERRFRDARLEQRAHMDAGDIAHWTKAIAKENKPEEAPE